MYYRSAGPWGPGKGSNLVAAEFDSNTYQLVQMIAAKAAQGVGLQTFSVVGDDLWASLTDGTILGPYKLPVVSVTFVGQWLPATQYYVNQIFTMNGSTYIVRENHTSASSFDPGANDGSGNDFYGLLLADPANALPIGGAPGQVLQKNLTADFSVIWAWPTLQGLSDVLQSPEPALGDLVYWNGAAFSYIPQADVVGSPPNLRDLSDVLPSPAPTAGQLVYWTGSAFSYESPSAVVGGPPRLQDLSDVAPTPNPLFGQLVYWNGSQFSYETMTSSLLTDYNLTSLAQYDLAYWDAANNQWRNRQPPPIYDAGWSGSFTLQLSHANELLDIATGGVITIPAHASIAFARGAAIWFRMNAATSSAFSFTTAGGVALSIPAGRIAQPRAYGSIVMLQQTSAYDNWKLSGDLAFTTTGNVLPASGTWNADPRLTDCDVYTWAPTGNNTVNVVSGGVILNKRMSFVITTSGTSSFTLTFGTGFKTTGTLATGTVSGKVFVIEFIGDGTNYNEVARTTAM